MVEPKVGTIGAAESAVARAALMGFFTETVRQLIGQLNPSQKPMDAAREAWAVTQYVRDRLEELKTVPGQRDPADTAARSQPGVF